MSSDPAGQLASWPVGTVAAAWSEPSGTLTTYGPIDATFKLASVTKPLVAYAMLVATEEGTLPLDAVAGPAGATVADLLAHSSGLGPEAKDPATDAHTRRIYSNAGFELAGRLLGDAAGMPTAQYLREAVCEPLGMTETWLEGSPAHGAVSTVSDLVRFCVEWLDPVLCHPTTIARATSPHLQQLTGVLPGYGRQDPNPWGLGVELRGNKSPHWTASTARPETFGHFGAAGTFFWIDPVDRSFAVALTDTAFGPWAVDAWPPFNDAIRSGWFAR